MIFLPRFREYLQLSSAEDLSWDLEASSFSIKKRNISLPYFHTYIQKSKSLKIGFEGKRSSVTINRLICILNSTDTLHTYSLAFQSHFSYSFGPPVNNQKAVTAWTHAKSSWGTAFQAFIGDMVHKVQVRCEAFNSWISSINHKHMASGINGDIARLHKAFFFCSATSEWN